MLQEAGGAGRGPSPTWILGTSTGPSWAGNGGSAQQEGFVCHPPSPGIKPSFYWNFGRQNNQRFVFLLCCEGECAEGLLQDTPTPPCDHKIPQKRGELWLWNCSRMGCWSRHQHHTFPSTPGWSSTLTENLFPTQKLPRNSHKCSSSSLSKYLLKKKNPNVRV